jgi:DNA gyrase subunit B
VSYEAKHIIALSDIEAIRKNSGMFVGSVETATRLLEECLDNSLDEVQSGECEIIGVFIDTKTKSFEVLDLGRGFPFDEKRPVEEDPPVLSSIKLFSSGKFHKGQTDSAYHIASGLHGAGLTAVNALSKEMVVEIYRDKKHATYQFKNATDVARDVEPFKGEKPFSTKIKVIPNPAYFEDPSVDVKVIEERLRIACCNYPKLKVILRVDGKDQLIKGTEEELILDYLSGTVPSWHIFENTKKIESYSLKLGWDNEPPGGPKILSCVNLIRVHSGVHINKLLNAIRETFAYLAKKYGYSFKPDDALYCMRSYLNLKIIKTSFEAQVKVKLESKSDLSVMDTLDSQLRKYFEANDAIRTELLEKFQSYRRSLQTKKMKTSNGHKRGSTQFTKLRDCVHLGGELIIGEGDSAIGGLAEVRDPNKHAILPLRGVIPNSLTKKDLLNNQEIKEIIQSLGCGIEEQCDITKLRYSKIILAADADPAGHFITSLLILLFARLMPPVIKEGKLFVCKTPLYGYGHQSGFIPIWTEEELKKYRTNGKTIRRFKGLGEYNPEELRNFTLDEKQRILIPVKWSDKYERIFELMSDASQKRKLVLGDWKL